MYRNRRVWHKAHGRHQLPWVTIAMEWTDRSQNEFFQIVARVYSSQCTRINRLKWANEWRQNKIVSIFLCPSGQGVRVCAEACVCVCAEQTNVHFEFRQCNYFGVQSQTEKRATNTTQKNFHLSAVCALCWAHGYVTHFNQNTIMKIAVIRYTTDTHTKRWHCSAIAHKAHSSSMGPLTMNADFVNAFWLVIFLYLFRCHPLLRSLPRSPSPSLSPSLSLSLSFVSLHSSNFDSH